MSPQACATPASRQELLEYIVGRKQEMDSNDERYSSKECYCSNVRSTDELIQAISVWSVDSHFRKGVP